MSGSVDTPGFVVVATQGRNLHWPTDDPQDGSKHDSFHRDFKRNRDVAFVDALIDGVVDDGGIDKQRIFISGWSNGARFAGLYGITRHIHPTPMGNRIAAISTYSGGDPYENIRHGQQPSCKLASYPTSTVPFMMNSRTCDVIACDKEQAESLAKDGATPGPGNIAATWIDDLKAMGVDARWQRITAVGGVSLQCNSFCGPTLARVNHDRWPDGVNDGSGEAGDYEIGMLGYLRSRPLR
jgi:poly(3-hydroxybutyrate) depolymerase